MYIFKSINRMTVYRLINEAGARSSGRDTPKRAHANSLPNFTQPQKQEKTQNREYIDRKRTICRATSEEAICAQKTANI